MNEPMMRSASKKATNQLPSLPTFTFSTTQTVSLPRCKNLALFETRCEKCNPSIKLNVHFKNFFKKCEIFHTMSLGIKEYFT